MENGDPATLCSATQTKICVSIVKHKSRKREKGGGDPNISALVGRFGGCMYVQCMHCKRSSKKNEQTGQLESIKTQQIPPEETVVWKVCAECIRKIQEASR